METFEKIPNWLISLVKTELPNKKTEFNVDVFFLTLHFS